MAVSRILGVLSLVGALVLLSNALPLHHGSSSRLRGPGAALADLLVGALDRLLDLATRRNMVLLCHAILLVLLGVPAARRRQSQSQSAAEEATTTAACYYYYSAAPGVVTTAAPVDGVARPLRQRLAVAVAAEPEHGEHVAVATKEIVLVEREKHLQAAAAAEPDHPVAAAAAMDLGRALVLADPQHNDGEAAAEQLAQEEEEEEVDTEEMNRRFDAFIAATKEKMRLEALHPHPAPSLPHNTALLAR